MADSTFVLVHGGAHTSKSWDLLRAELKARGYESAAMNIPSADPSLGLSDYADVVVQTMNTIDGPVVLVGHSLNGLTIPIAAARFPVSALVFVCALLPEIGKGYDPMLEEEKITAEVQSAINMHSDGIIFEMDPVLSVPAFYNETPPDVVEWAVADLVPQSNVSVMPTPLTEWPQVATFYVVGKKDHAIRPEWSRRAAREQLGIEPIEVDSDHSPFLSRPAELADILVGIAEGKYPAGQGR